jgi:hypothetical protein
MPTLADIRRGDVFLAGARCTAADQVAGLTLGLYGPHRDKMADVQVTPAGAVTGQLAAAPALIPVQLVTGLTPLSAGDVMENGQTGETAVVRYSQIRPDGTVVWSSAVTPRVVYPAAGWTVIGHADL